MPEEHELGLVLVTAPTGDGKTESARFAASLLGRTVGARGLNFALPTMGTADAMLPRVEAFAARALSGERALAAARDGVAEFTRQRKRDCHVRRSGW